MGVSRQDTAKPESYLDAAGVDPAGIVGKRQGLPWETSESVRTKRTTSSAMAVDGPGGVSRGHSRPTECIMRLDPASSGEGPNFLSAGRQTG